MFRFLARCSILTCLVFGLINRAVCRSDLFTNDLSDGDIGPDSFLDEPYGSSMLGQFTDDVPTENNLFANDLLADNLVANDGQSCRQPSKKFKARRSDGQSCTDADAPSSNDFTNSDERLLTNTEVRRYWCSSAAPNVYSVIPVCSLFPASQTYYDELPSTLSQSSFPPSFSTREFFRY